MLGDFISLIYPENCLSCGEILYKHEKHICFRCRYKLPKTDFHKLNENPVSKLFWGRIGIFSASAYYFFTKGGGVQHLLHAIKYRGEKEAGSEVGKMYGSELKDSPFFETVDLVLPVPLHPKKKKIRGYNQSDFIAQGIAEGMGKSYSPDLLVRNVANESQTRKSRFVRWQNVESIFEIKDKAAVEGKHILIVDDIITTGATIEASAQCIQNIDGTKVSVAALAFTQH
ncbi:MAG: ComF family protein [Bacteroidetes bacterium]|nr:ComF family protein [Bacteroidota bacterium]